MRDFILDSVKKIKPSGIRKFFDLANGLEDCISLGVGEPDFDTPWAIREEGIRTLEKGYTFYTSNAGLKQLRESICSFVKRRYDMDYLFDETLVTVGGSEAIDIALRCLVEKGDEVIIPSPSYVSYLPCVELTGATPVDLPLKEENNFKLKACDLEKAITKNTKVIIMSFPNNPTGAIMTKEDNEKIARLIIKHDLFVISDEIYSELTYDGSHHSISTIPGMKERTLVINGFSKAFSMTGWRLGYALGPISLIKQMTKVHQFCIMCAPTTSQFAAIKALDSCQDEVNKMVDEYNQRRLYLLSRLKSMGIDSFEPKGAFYLFVPIKKFGLSSEEFALRLLESERLITVPGTAFGDSGEGFLRMSYASSLNDLIEAMKRFERFIKSLS